MYTKYILKVNRDLFEFEFEFKFRYVCDTMYCKTEYMLVCN